MVGTERHVGDKQRAAHGPAHGARVVQHLIQRHGQSGVIAEHRHPQRVAHQQKVDAGLVDDARGRIVIGGQRGDRLRCPLFGFKRRERDLPGLRCGQRRGRGFPRI